MGNVDFSRTRKSRSKIYLKILTGAKLMSPH
jgi:hypothetical protein